MFRNRTRIRCLPALAIAPLLLFSTLASAALVPASLPVPVRPNSLQCVTKNTTAELAFNISRLDTSQAHTSLDPSAEGSAGNPIASDPLTTRLCSENGTENKPCFLFMTDDLRRLAEGKSECTVGLMSYFEETVAIECSPGALARLQ